MNRSHLDRTENCFVDSSVQTSDNVATIWYVSIFLSTNEFIVHLLAECNIKENVIWAKANLARPDRLG